MGGPQRRTTIFSEIQMAADHNNQAQRTRRAVLSGKAWLVAGVRCCAGLDGVQGSGVISTTPPGTTAIRSSCPANSRIPSSTSSPTPDTSTGRQPPPQATSAA